MIVGRYNALEFALIEGQPVARRYTVYARVEHGSHIVSDERDQVPVETLALPLAPDRATAWLWLHFEDLEVARMRKILVQLT